MVCGLRFCWLLIACLFGDICFMIWFDCRLVCFAVFVSCCLLRCWVCWLYFVVRLLVVWFWVCSRGLRLWLYFVGDLCLLVLLGWFTIYVLFADCLVWILVWLVFVALWWVLCYLCMFDVVGLCIVSFPCCVLLYYG